MARLPLDLGEDGFLGCVQSSVPRRTRGVATRRYVKRKRDSPITPASGKAAAYLGARTQPSEGSETLSTQAKLERCCVIPMPHCASVQLMSCFRNTRHS